jgi:hypothetical protein
MSIAIPTYEAYGKGSEYLEFQFHKFLTQTFKDFEIVISDHSQNEDIYNLCDKYSTLLNIKYIRNNTKIGNSSANLNNAIKYCSGDFIKIIFQDDFLYENSSLEHIINSLNDQSTWLITACDHSIDCKNFIRPLYPNYHDKIYLGYNTISSPSVLCIKNNKETILFDENLIWLMDVDYYKQCFNKFGYPQILNIITVVNRISNTQLTNHISEYIKKQELSIVIEKYGI